uniref:Uncharacterized protein n=1 Tax=Amphimedon queenslandica TaxID=400682 RepID=A0A1X7UXK8_AMPQE
MSNKKETKLSLRCLILLGMAFSLMKLLIHLRVEYLGFQYKKNIRNWKVKEEILQLANF